MKNKRHISIRLRAAALLCLALLSGSLVAFGQANPFDLAPRLPDSVQMDTLLDVAAVSGNPFDLVAPSPGAPIGAIAPEAPPPQSVVESPFSPKPSITIDSSYRRMLLILTLSSLLLLTILVTFFRTHLIRAYRAFLNDNMLTHLQRERDSGGALPYFLFYGLFFFNAGFYAFLLARYFGLSIPATPWPAFLSAAAVVAIFFLGKHLLLSIMGGIFPVRKEAKLYSSTMMTFNIILGILLIVANLMIAYSSESNLTLAVYGSLGLAGLLYLFMALRSLLIASRFLAFHKFHFLLYLCSVEIAPVAILAKLILN